MKNENSLTLIQISTKSASLKEYNRIHMTPQPELASHLANRILKAESG